MNEILKSLHRRKSVRAYEDRPVSPEIKEALLDAALQAPTAGNMSLFTILDITDPALKQKLSVSCDNQPFIADAPLVFVFCADYQRWYDVFCRHLDSVRRPAEGDLMLAMADTLIAAQNTVTAAESLGLGSCYIGDIMENYEYHRELLSLPPYVLPVAMLCLGWPTAQQQNRAKPGRFRREDLVHENGYDRGKAAAMENMLLGRGEGGALGLEEWLRRFCQRKWNSDFSVEMSRSCRAMIQSWCREDNVNNP